MIKKINVGKIVVVMILTMLIWIMADLSQDDTYTIPTIDIIIAESTSRDMMVSLEGKSRVTVKNIEVLGSASRIAVLRRESDEGTFEHELIYNINEYEQKPESGQYSLDVKRFLKESAGLKELGITVESCEPSSISVEVKNLTEKSLTAECRNKDGKVILGATCEPASVTMYVPPDWEGESLKAIVQVDPMEEEQGRKTAIEKTPFIELPNGQKRQSLTAVKVRTPPKENLLKEFSITDAVFGITLSKNMQGKYRVEVTNFKDVVDTFTILATQEAYDAYKNMVYQVILETEDKDAQAQEANAEHELKREVIYNFPAEYVGNGSIKLKNPPVYATFKLIKQEAAAPVQK